MEVHKNNKEKLFKFLEDEAKGVLKVKTGWDFARFMESVKNGHPDMSAPLKKTLSKITERECFDLF